MCVSLAPARFSNTTLYAAEVLADRKVLHVLGYQNTAQNLYRAAVPLDEGDWDWQNPRGKPAKGATGNGNAMILPFPAAPGSMSQANVLSTAQCPRILKDMAEAVRPRMRGSRGLSFGADSFIAKSVQIFEHDIYTVVLATDARLIGKVLDAVPAEKRPKMQLEILDAYAAWYPDWAVALCCFNNGRAKEAKPLLWWYEPMKPEFLFAPALDSHTGGVPDLAAEVEVDHSVAFGHYAAEAGEDVAYSDAIPAAIRPFLTPKVVGGQFNEVMPNGDFVCRVSDIRRGDFSPKRLPPPGAHIQASV